MAEPPYAPLVLLAVAFPFTIARLPMPESPVLAAEPVPTPDPPYSPVVVLLAVTFPLKITKVPMPDLP
jgi:hypothetical protein